MSDFSELATDWKIPSLEGLSDTQEIEPPVFPAHVLPQEVSVFCQELARVTQAPLEFSASTCLATLSACLGKGVIVLDAFRGDSNKPTLQFLIAGESGSGKSVVNRPVMAPFNKWIEKQRKMFLETNLPNYKTRAAILEGEIAQKIKGAARSSNSVERDICQAEAANKQAELDAINRLGTFPSYLLEDCTLEAMAVNLGKNAQTGQEAVFAVSDDARQALSTLLGKYTNGEVSDNLFVKGFSWSPHSQHRRKEGGSVELLGPCVNVLFMIQPDLLDRIISQPDLMHSGFLQRVILDEIVWPGTDYCDPGAYSGSVLDGWESLVTRLLDFYRTAKTPYHAFCSEEAKDVLISYYNRLNARIKNPGDLGDIQSVARRWAEWAWRLALNFHCVIYKEKAVEIPIEIQTAQNGIVLSEYYAQRKLYVLNSTRDNRKQEVRLRILDLAQDKEFVLAADVQRKRLARTAEEARLLLDQLASAGHLKGLEVRLPKGGPTSYRYYLPEKYPIPLVTNAINGINAEITQPF
jgi:hypothetical protein